MEDVKKLVEENQGLVYSIATKYFYTFMSENKDYSEDLIQEGEIGLIKASIYFNEDMGYKFSTYAYISIYRNMKRYYDSIIKYKVANVVYFENKIADTDSEVIEIKDIISKDSDIDYDFIDQYVWDRLEKLGLKNIIKMRMEGATLSEIGDIEKRTRQAIDFKIKRCRDRLKRDKRFMESLGVGIDG